jgi:hypothetical protein
MTITNMNIYMHSFGSHEQWNHNLVFLNLAFPLTECSVSDIMSQCLFLQLSTQTHRRSKTLKQGFFHISEIQGLPKKCVHTLTDGTC